MLKVVLTILLTFEFLYSFSQDLEKVDSNRLFSSSEPIEITIQLDMAKILNDTSEDPQYSQAKLIQKNDTKSITVFDIKIKPRGNTRRINSICDFPLLKINFQKESTINTVFEGQDKIKMVTHCQESDAYQNYAMLEYLIYKTYTMVTDYSYRVRLANVTYQDVEQNYNDIQRTAFFIEDDDLLAERIGGEITDKKIWSADSCDQKTVDILSMFQFMIGNTDWWIHTRHNIDLVSLKSDELIPIPFDFDYAGIINTPYAIPSTQLPISSVKNRFFKGSCKPIIDYQETINLFNSRRSSITNEVQNANYLDKKYKKAALSYIEDFYEIINNLKEFDEYLVQTCDFLNNPPDKASILQGKIK